MSEAAASLPAETDDGDANESASPPAKHAKTDSRSVSLKLPATAAVTLVPMIGYHVTMIGYVKKQVSHPYGWQCQKPREWR